MSLPPQTPLGGGSGSSSLAAVSRSVVAQTPLKTPLRTPMRTPGGGEQLSHTPVISFAAIEAHKENVQPLVQGRSAHALNNALSRRQAELTAQRKQFEDVVQSAENSESDDPLEGWTRYVKWCIDSYPSGQTSESELLLVLERCTRLFRTSTQYQNDSRYLRMWILYARNVDCPADIYNFLISNEIGTSLASLYEELAIVYEGQSSLDKADETFRLGIHRSAQPIDRLKRRYIEFQSRILTQEGRADGADRQTFKEALRSAMTKAQRSMLGTKVGATSLSSNTVRGLGGQAGLAKVSAIPVSNNARRPALFKDVDGEDVFARSSKTAAAGWTDVGTAASRKQEKGPEAKAWKGEVLPQRDGVATPKRPAIAIYRDSDEEDASDRDGQGRTPGRVKAGDVFSKAREPSETDKLRHNPFANYGEKEMKVRSAKTKSAAEEAPSTSSKSKSKKSSHSSSAKAPTSAGPAQKKECYAVPLRQLYPGLDLEVAVRNTARKQRSGEVCIEELFAKRYLPTTNSGGNDSSDDPWAYLDARQGQWLPEIKKPIKARPMKRDPTVTAFTKAAQDEVMSMFNGGMANSDDEESSEDDQSESDEEEDDDIQMSVLKENDVQPTPTPGPRNGAVLRPLGQLPILGEPSRQEEEQATPIPATPIRKPFGGDRKPLGVKPTFDAPLDAQHAFMPQRIAGDPVVEEDDEDSDDEAKEEQRDAADPLTEIDANGPDYLNMPMRELAPLSPITEATEYTRFTQQSTRTPATSIRQRPSEDRWTPSAAESGLGHGSASYDNDPAAFDESLPHLHGHQQHAETGLSDGMDGVVVEVDGPVEEAKADEDEKMEHAHEDGHVFPNPVCPVDVGVIEILLGNLPLPLESSPDYVDITSDVADQLPGLQKRAAQVAKRRSSGHSSVAAANTTAITAAQGWTMSLGDLTLTVRHKLGEGGYGAVYLVEDNALITGRRQQMVGGINGDASFANLNDDYDGDDDDMDADEDGPKLIAVKVETPPNRWEFYILGQLRARLTDSQRLSSIICARKFFCFRDESFLMLEYAEKGTLLEIVNNAVKAGVASSSALAVGGGGMGGAASVGIDEVLAMFFVVEVIKIVEALHAVDLLHGDLKIDNCLLRLDEGLEDEPWAHAYDRNGTRGWAAKGITLIDFGRAIDLRMFPADQRFLADWTPEPHDMPQIHAARSWRHEIDYYGVASIAYCLLFGKYIELSSTSASPQYAIDKPLRRYWQVDIWNALFALCLNSEHAEDAPAQLADVRTRMETWLEANCFRAGKNLKGSLKKLELWSMKRTM